MSRKDVERGSGAVARMLGGSCDGYLRRVELDVQGRPPLEIVVTQLLRKPWTMHVYVLLAQTPELVYVPE